MWKRLAYWSIMMGLASVIAFLVCELGIRIWGVMDASPDVFVINPDMKVTFNKEGMRDRDHAPTKEAGIFRILVLGDSITYGVSVEADQTYVKQLERLLNTRDRPQKFEVMNTGVPGWNTSYEEAYLKAKGLHYQPDLVVIGFCLNDAELAQPPPDLFLSDGSGHSYPEALSVNAKTWLTPLLKWKQSIHWTPSDYSPVHTLKNYLGGHSHLYRFIRWRYDMLMRHIDNRDEYPNALYRPDTESWRRCREALQHIAHTMRKRQAPVVLVIFPFFVKLKQNRWFNDEGYPWKALHRLLRATGREAGMTVVDLLPRYIGYDPRDISVDPYHPNPEGHRIAAEAIYEAFVENKLIPLKTSFPSIP